MNLVILLLIGAVGVQLVTRSQLSANGVNSFNDFNAASAATGDLPAGLAEIIQQDNPLEEADLPIGSPDITTDGLPDGLKEIVGGSTSTTATTEEPDPVPAQPATAPEPAPVSEPASLVTGPSITIDTASQGKYGSVLRQTPNGKAYPPVPGKTAGIDAAGNHTHLVPNGAIVPLLASSGDWYQVTHEGVTGWVWKP